MAQRELPNLPNNSDAVRNNQPYRQPNQNSTATTETEFSFWQDLAKSLGQTMTNNFKRAFVDSLDNIGRSVLDAVLQSVNRSFWGEDTKNYVKPRSYRDGYRYYQTTVEDRREQIRNDIQRQRSTEFTFFAVDTIEEAIAAKQLIVEDIDNYDKCTVASIKTQLNIPQTSTDLKFGWTSKQGIEFTRANGRYEFRLPTPHQLD